MKHALLFAVILAASCRGLVYPSAQIVPEVPAPGALAGEFTVLTEAGEPVSSRSFLGHPLIVIGAPPDFAGDMLPWVEALIEEHGAPGEAYVLMLVLEGAGRRSLARIDPYMPDGIRFHLDPRSEFASSQVVEYVRPEGAPRQERMAPVIKQTPFGFIGEGPHLVAISPDGTIAGIMDGPLSRERRARFIEAAGRAIRGL